MECKKNWVKWKNELCALFDKETWSVTKNTEKSGLFKAMRELRQRLRQPQEDWRYTLGIEPLTEIWQMDYRDLHDLENPFQFSGSLILTLFIN